jgi:cytochrome c biogenesis protein CcmG, thiol:disulfide interchange protein DsbE
VRIDPPECHVPYPWRRVKRSAAPLVAVLVAASLVALLVYGVVQRGGGSSLDGAVIRGELPAAPGEQRRLPTLGRPGTRSLADYRGKVVVLNFWASWCTPCRDEAPLLQAANRRLARAGNGTVLGVTYLDTPTDSASFVREFGLSFLNVRDVDTKLAQDFGTRRLPETFVLDRRGRIVAISRGQFDKPFLDHALRKALQ